MTDVTSDHVLMLANNDVDLTTKLCTVSEEIQTSNNSSPQRRILQNHRVIWLIDANIDESSEYYQSAIAELQNVVNDVDIFTDLDDCVDCLTDIIQEKVFMIISKSISEQILPLIYDASQLDAIYLFTENDQKDDKILFEDCFKIKGEYTEVILICEDIKQAVQQCDQNLIPISFLATADGTTNINLDELDASFMYTQLFKEIILDTKYSAQAKNDLVDYWRSHYIGHKSQLKIIKEFEDQYSAGNSIRWYTRPIFIYQMLNRALRTLEADIMIKMGCFIRDLHHQLKELHAEQFRSDDAESFTVYRGQALSNEDFQKLVKSKGGLMSFNNFLSTSANQDTSYGFAKNSLANSELISILFEITVDPKMSSIPYARIGEVAYFENEKEILFSMHSVFRIGEIEKINNNDALYRVKLNMTADDDPQLRAVTNRIREQTYPTEKHWYRLAILLIKVGQFQQAEDFCKTVQKEEFTETENACFYHTLGMIKNGQGDYAKAIGFYEKVIEMSEKISAPNDATLATLYNNIAAVYYTMGEYSKALSFCEKALEIRQNILPPDDLSLAISYNNIGTLYSKTGESLKAISFHEQALEIQRKVLPEDHPDLATSYSNIGTVYWQRGAYTNALSFLEKALAICRKILPKNHPTLAIRYTNIALLCAIIGKSSKAFSFIDSALQIQEVLPANHPALPVSYSNHGAAYERVGEYSKALSFYEKSLEIKQATLPANHPDLATSFNNIGSMHHSMGEYSKALSFYEKALEIMQATLLADHPDLATLFNNIGSVYYQMGEYEKALSYIKKALKIMLTILPANHPNLGTSFNNIGSVYHNMGENSKALFSLKRALEIKQETLPANHPELASSFNNIGSVYRQMGEYSKALNFYDRALQVHEQTLPENHVSFAAIYQNISMVYFSKNEYANALSYAKRALHIAKKSLPADHPALKELSNHVTVVRDLRIRFQ